MIILWLVVAGVWSEWRYYKGLQQRFNFDVEYIKTHMLQAAEYAYYHGAEEGKAATIQFLKDINILSLDNKPKK